MKPVLINLKIEQLPDELVRTPEFIGASYENGCYCVLFKHGDDDYSAWETEDMTKDTYGSSGRGDKAYVIYLVEFSDFILAAEFLRSLED